VVLRGGPFRSFLGASDTRLAFVDGDDWLALVNRSPTGALAPDYAPSDLVDLRDGRPRKAAECSGARECLREDAAKALARMLAAMKADGLEGRVQSAFRAFATQCWVFASWAQEARGGFCEATEQSALPGHSQHQLGTTVDLFTAEWAERGKKTGEGVFRSGFGCTTGGRWLVDNAWRFGFVAPYPIHPDDRREALACAVRTDRKVPINPMTGYKSEPWHWRFVGDEAARAFHGAWLASGPGSPDEITLEQWLRARRGWAGDAELPVCDGCQCGACATLSQEETRTPCGKAALWLDSTGHPVSPEQEPTLVDARVANHADRTLVVEITLHAPAHTPTQPPVVGADGPAYGEDETFLAVPVADGGAPHRYPDLPDAWRVAAEPSPATAVRWPWRASLAAPELAATWNRANLLLPSAAGDLTVRLKITVAPGAPALRVTLLRNGEEHGTRDVAIP
jgi:D-alanyl-D-alanine carboxypeptidase